MASAVPCTGWPSGISVASLTRCVQKFSKSLLQHELQYLIPNFDSIESALATLRVPGADGELSSLNDRVVSYREGCPFWHTVCLVKIECGRIRKQLQPFSQKKSAMSGDSNPLSTRPLSEYLSSHFLRVLLALLKAQPHGPPL
jgi:hypothetical protein